MLFQIMERHGVSPSNSQSKRIDNISVHDGFLSTSISRLNPPGDKQQTSPAIGSQTGPSRTIQPANDIHIDDFVDVRLEAALKSYTEARQEDLVAIADMAMHN